MGKNQKQSSTLSIWFKGQAVCLIEPLSIRSVVLRSKSSFNSDIQIWIIITDAWSDRDLYA